MEYERSAGDYPGAAREKVATDQVLEDGALTRALCAHHGYLRELDALPPHRVEDVLQLVDDRDELLHLYAAARVEKLAGQV